jgi:two-component system phosphate regulon sensor histidine kinase PhoR
MNKRKLRIARILMSASMILLVLFQWYWLRNAWREAYPGLRREVSVMFRESMVRNAMRNFGGLQLREGHPIGGDTGRNTAVFVFKNRLDTSLSIASNHQARVKSDSNAATVRVVQGQPLRMPNFGRDGQRDEKIDYSRLRLHFIVPGDSASIVELDTIFKNALGRSDIRLGYAMRVLSDAERDTLVARGEIGDRMRLPGAGPVMGNLMEIRTLEYNFDNPAWYLLGSIKWPIAFSFLMLSLTGVAFVFLYRQLLAQQRLADIKNEFISNITHELKTPIATVGVAIEALKNFNAINDPARTQEYLDISQNELHRLGLLVDKVLKLSMFEQNKIELNLQPVDVKAVAEEVVQSMRLQIEKAGAAVQWQAEGTGFVVQGDRLHLLSVLYNLVDNALKYSPNNPSIGISLLQTNGTVRLQVQDNGVGIPAEYKDKVFEKFFRVPHGNTHNTKGYGLGLSYVSEVVRQHGGTIQVSSLEGNGSTFTIELPRQRG